MPTDSDARRYYRVADKRLEDARLILAKLGRTTVAVYLDGYVVECLLKALILAETPDHNKPVIARRFIGQKAHDLEVLAGWYRQATGRKLPADVTKLLVLVRTWNTDLRYDPTEAKLEAATQFLSAVEQIWIWADQRL